MITRADSNLAAAAFEDLHNFDVGFAETGKTRPLFAQITPGGYFHLIRRETMIAILTFELRICCRVGGRLSDQFLTPVPGYSLPSYDKDRRIVYRGSPKMTSRVYKTGLITTGRALLSLAELVISRRQIREPVDR